MSSAFHYYLTFNPYLNDNYESGYTQAHEFREFLKGRIEKDSSATAFWGKFIGQDRKHKVDIELFKTILAKNSEQGLSTHLYITDFNNLWVGKVKSITDKLPNKNATLSFYEGKNVEIWFEIEDFTLTHSNSSDTASKLSELYIDHEHNEMEIQGMSPFTTSVRYPCLLQDIAEEQYFDEFDREQYTHLILKENLAINRSVDNAKKVLHAYVFPEEMYAKIPHTAKLEIETAEIDILENRHHNSHQIAFSYLRALEIVLNDLVVHNIRRKGMAKDFYVDATSAPPRLYLNPTKDYFITLKEHNKNFSIPMILNFVDRAVNGGHLEFKKAFSEHKQFIRYLTKELGPLVRDNDLIKIRNHLAHGEMNEVSVKQANEVRSLVLGVGIPGLIHMCYKTFYHEKFSTKTEKPKKSDKKNVLKLVG